MCLEKFFGICALFIWWFLHYQDNTEELWRFFFLIQTKTIIQWIEWCYLGCPFCFSEVHFQYFIGCTMVGKRHFISYLGVHFCSPIHASLVMDQIGPPNVVKLNNVNLVHSFRFLFTQFTREEKKKENNAIFYLNRNWGKMCYSNKLSISIQFHLYTKII